MARASHEAALGSPDAVHSYAEEKRDLNQVERVLSGDDEKTDHVNFDRIDDEVAKYANATGSVVITEEENKRLKRLVDKRVLPIMVITYFLQALDKGTMSFTSIMGIRDDIPVLKDNHYWGWLTTCIYLAVLVVEYPTNWTIQRVPIAKYLGFNILAWSTVLACHSLCFSFPALVSIRTLLGIFEAVCQPAFLLMSSIWYKREEQAQVVTYWYMMNGAQQIVGGLLAYAFSHIRHRSYLLHPGNASIRSWQAIFITYGSFSFCWGLFVLYWLPDSPMRAKCFSEEDKKLLVERVRSNQTGLQNKKFRSYQLKEALLDPQTYCYMLIQICTTIPTSGLGAFYQIIIKDLKFSVLETQLLAMVLGAVIIFTLMGSAYLTKTTNQNLLTMGLFLIPSFIGTIVIMTVKNTSAATRAGLLISYYIVFTFWAAQGLGMSMLTRNVGGSTKKSICITMNFLAWCAGNATGPQIFFNGDGPRYLKAFSVHLGCYTLLVCVIIFLRFNLTMRNKKKDREFGTEINTTHGFDDLTDRENPNFRYVT
ncbi:MFS general substrate transporter [Dothidotthia symphoricarpi CBS 119687]|uniref:MFS general substrate transporter n=1 Tax=Dothidotthia symphoricarpi CBS 119687 TaxID=1392245 RepID=A0A6A6ALF4_9PLEO|nr:MFS general substrate transporter [Dothidotthia symphoricarpi CBS 119687]KAF2132023.1 MFS general substrate transporter [Dothidotthia symphoricarpi CBS 119687]